MDTIKVKKTEEDFIAELDAMASCDASLKDDLYYIVTVLCFIITSNKLGFEGVMSWISEYLSIDTTEYFSNIDDEDVSCIVKKRNVFKRKGNQFCDVCNYPLSRPCCVIIDTPSDGFSQALLRCRNSECGYLNERLVIVKK